jgi:nicotinate dehydrogenase subunit A
MSSTRGGRGGGNIPERERQNGVGDHRRSRHAAAYVLRNEFGLHGPRFGCGLGQCGACTVHVDGAAVRSCVTPISAVTGRIVTLEGLGTDANPHPVQQAFIDEQAVQCGYCINGMIMQSAALLARNPKPSEQDVKTELANNLCRCGTHLRIVRAVMRAAGA